VSRQESTLAEKLSSIWGGFDDEEWDFTYEITLREEVPIAGIEVWSECSSKGKLENVVVTHVDNTSRAGMLGLTVPSKLLKVDDQPIEGLDQNRFRKMLRTGQHRLTFGVGKLRDSAIAAKYGTLWQCLNKDLRLMMDEPAKPICSKEDGRGGFYHISMPKVVDARRLYVLGLEFLIDHIGTRKTREQEMKQATVENWLKVIGAWADENEVRTRIRNMSFKECGNIIFQCVHQTVSANGQMSYELVGFCQFFPEGNDQRSLYLSKLMVRKAHQRRGLAQLMYRCALHQVKEKLSANREQLFGNLNRCTLNVLADNHAAMELYRKLGYRVTKETPSRVLTDATMIQMEAPFQ